jgi:hypothetical protein
LLKATFVSHHAPGILLPVMTLPVMTLPVMTLPVIALPVMTLAASNFSAALGAETEECLLLVEAEALLPLTKDFFTMAMSAFSE